MPHGADDVPEVMVHDHHPLPQHEIRRAETLVAIEGFAERAKGWLVPGLLPNISHNCISLNNIPKIVRFCTEEHTCEPKLPHKKKTWRGRRQHCSIKVAYLGVAGAEAHGVAVRGADILRPGLGQEIFAREACITARMFG